MNTLALELATLNNHPNRADEFGFAAVIRDKAPVSLGDLAYEVRRGCSRAGALLRRVHEMLNDGLDINGQRYDDIWDLVQMALETVPDPDKDVFDPLDTYRDGIGALLKRVDLEKQALARMVEAMAGAGRADATVEEIREAAREIHDYASQLPDGSRYLEAFCTLVRNRGYLVEQRDSGEGVPPFPSVYESAAALKKDNKRRRKDAPMIAELARKLNEIGERHRVARQTGAELGH